MKNIYKKKSIYKSIGHEFVKLYSYSDKVESKNFLEEIIDKKQGTRSEMEARFLRARAYEAGWFGPVDYGLAEHDYKFIINNFSKRVEAKIIDECMLGLARILFMKKEKFNDIKEICDNILSKRKSHKALTLIGLGYEEIKKDYKTASKYYMRSFFAGSKRALAFYSYAKYKCGRYVIGTIALIVYYILYPILSLFDKSKHYLF